jgi:hypothetical protein
MLGVRECRASAQTLKRGPRVVGHTEASVLGGGVEGADVHPNQTCENFEWP